MNTITTDLINEVGKFIEIGNNIRNRQELLVPRSEDMNVLSFEKREDIELQFFYAESEGHEGRVMAYIENGQGFLGWYECDEDMEVHQAVMDSACEWLSSQGVNSVIGPVNGSTWGQYRFNLDCEYPLFVGEPYQPLFYIDFWEYSGFESHLFYKTEHPSKSLLQETSKEQVVGYFAQDEISIHNFPQTLGEQLEDELYVFYDECFKTNPHYSLIDKDSYLKLSRKIEPIIHTDYSYLLRNKSGKIISVFVCFQDIYHQLKSSAKEHQYQKLILKTIATHPDYQNKKIGTIMVNLIHNQAYANGFEKVIHAMMFSGNITSKVGSKKFNTQVLHTYVVLRKDL